MKKFKIILLLIVLGLIALAVYQNLEFLKSHQSIELNLFITHFKGEAVVGVLMLALFIAGLLISYFLTLAQRFKNRKAIRQLNEQLNAERKKAAELEARLGEGGGQKAEQEQPAGQSSGESGQARPNEPA